MNFPRDDRSSKNEPNLESGKRSLERGPLFAAQAASFEWYLRRFKYIYRDAGVLPVKTWQLRDEASGLCLGIKDRTWGNAKAPRAEVSLLPCEQERTRNSMQWWQRSNRHDNGKCCSGLRVWNTDQCLVSSGSNDRLRTSVCNLEGPAAQRATVWKGPGLNLDRGCVTVSAAGVPQLGSCAGNVTKFRQHYGAPTDEFKLLSPKAKKVWTYDRLTDQGEDEISPDHNFRFHVKDKLHKPDAPPAAISRELEHISRTRGGSARERGAQRARARTRAGPSAGL